MASTHKPYNKREFITTKEGITIAREGAYFNLMQDSNNKDILHASDRTYIKMPDGSLRRYAPKMIKRKRKGGDK